VGTPEVKDCSNCDFEPSANPWCRDCSDFDKWERGGAGQVEMLVAEKPSPLATQVGGGHYKDMVIQPIEFSMANKLDACQHSIVKYACRFRMKNGKQDLLKIKHFVDILIEQEYSE